MPLSESPGTPEGMVSPPFLYSLTLFVVTLLPSIISSPVGHSSLPCVSPQCSSPEEFQYPLAILTTGTFSWSLTFHTPPSSQPLAPQLIIVCRVMDRSTAPHNKCSKYGLRAWERTMDSTKWREGQEGFPGEDT